MKLPNCWAIVCSVCGLLAVVTPAAHAQIFATLANFSAAQGSAPFSPLIQGRDGSFYGVAVNGGANGVGTVFSVTPVGAVATVYDFCAQAGCADGANPYGVLTLASV
ncbi:MAG: choice-of-anchor tandem repeat GloVer-containing protein [Candidatus Sulfotelmatobacter sp.]